MFELRAMFVSREWLSTALSTKPEGQEVTALIGRQEFWDGVREICVVTGPLVVVLRLVDGDRPAMGYLYEAMDRAKECIKKHYEDHPDDDNEFGDKFSIFWSIIDERWDNMLHHPIHAMGAMLNPSLLFAKKSTLLTDPEVMRGVSKCICSMVRDPTKRARVLKDMEMYKMSLGFFGFGGAIETRNDLSPDVWWTNFGGDTPELQNIAIRILSQTCTSSGCERNWSAFEKIHSKRRNRADIWSFGITALELAHGHAPFSKFPPMKVLLMTLQNAPPGLDYERDKKFSKSFKEIVAMCLVKDPSKRPSAEKLLKHHFFKHARTNDYIVRTVLDGLPPLGECFRTLKMREMDRVAQNRVAYGEKEEKSQSEYIRGISAWNFDIEELKARAALIQDDDEVPFVKEQAIDSKPTGRNLGWTGASPHSYSPFNYSRMENTGKDGDHDTRVELIPASSLLLPQSTTVTKEHLDFSYNGMNACNSTWKDSIIVDSTESSKVGRKFFDKDHILREDVYDASLLGRKVLSGPLVPECVLLSGDGDREKHQRQLQQRNFSGPLIACSTSNNHSFYKPLEDKTMVPFIEQKGRFKITSKDVDLKEILSQPTFNHSPPRNVASIPTSAILPTLQIILEQNIMQTEQIINLIKHVKQGETPQVWHSNNLNLQHPNLRATENKPEANSDEERKLLHQIAVLERKVENLLDELHNLKIKNLQLEQQLNAALNREKVERSRKEDAAQDIQRAI